MEIKDLFLTYESKCNARKAAEEKAAQLRREAARLDERASKKREKAEEIMSKSAFPDWIDEIVVPLAKELAKRKGLQSCILGPMGVGSRVIIALVPAPEEILSKQEHYRLTIQPDFHDEKLQLKYETGEETNKHKKGTLGEKSGLNYVTAPLPDSIDEIEQLLVKVSALQ